MTYFNTFPDLETSRLLLRKITLTDNHQLFELLSDPRVAEYEYFYPIKALEEANNFISRYEKEFESQEEITWGIILKSTNTLIGTCCIGDISQNSRRGEIGYSIIFDQWGNGYATEAVKAIVNFGFEVMNLNRIEAIITPENLGSIKVLEKLHFIQEGILRQRDFIKGKLEDGLMMSLLQKEIK